MSAETLEFHHDKHHAAYVTNGNNLLKGTEWEGLPIEQVITGSYGKNAPVFNNAAQIWNHAEFWKYLKPNGGGKVPGKVEKALIEGFGSVEKALEDLPRPASPSSARAGPGWRSRTARSRSPRPPTPKTR